MNRRARAPTLEERVVARLSAVPPLPPFGGIVEVGRALVAAGDLTLPDILRIDRAFGRPRIAGLHFAMGVVNMLSVEHPPLIRRRFFEGHPPTEVPDDEVVEQLRAYVELPDGAEPPQALKIWMARVRVAWTWIR